MLRDWRNCYLDLIFVPLGLLLLIVYHGWLWRKVRSHPNQTDIGINSAARAIWVMAMMKENNNKDILVVQTVRNAIMGSTVMATASIFLSSGLAAIIGSTYNVSEPIASAVYGAHGSMVVVLKFVTILVVLLFAFLFYSLSINSMNQVIFLINIPHAGDDQGDRRTTQDYVCGMLEKGFLLQTVGSRFFYTALPLVLWVFGPVLVFLCSVTVVSILFNIDIVGGKDMTTMFSESV